MVLPQHQTEHYYLKLLEIKTPLSATPMLFQNGQQSSYTWNTKVYPYLPFSIRAMDRRLELDTPEAEISMANTDTVRNFVKTYNGFLKSVCTIYTIFPDEPLMSPLVERLQVSSYAIAQNTISFKLQSPISAITGNIPSKYYDPLKFRELPVINQPSTR